MIGPEDLVKREGGLADECIVGGGVRGGGGGGVRGGGGGGGGRGGGDGNIFYLI